MTYEIFSTRTGETLMTVEADGMVEVIKQIEGISTDCIEFVNNTWATGLLTFEKSPNYGVRPKE
jgi:hypothetical protein